MWYRLLFAVAGSLTAFSAQAQDTGPSGSPVQRRVELAQKHIQSDPKSVQAYNDLAFALCRWARDTGNPQLYDKADAALQRSLQLSPGNLDAKKLQVTVLIGKRQFADALKLASGLQFHNHDDIGLWGLLVDCNIGLAHLEEAERDAQWILDLRSGSSLGFTKAASLRELFGDPQGAVEYFEEALRRTSQSDVDERAWLMTQDARLQSKLGNVQRSEELLKQALQLFPDSHQALSTLATLPAKKQPNQATR